MKTLTRFIFAVTMLLFGVANLSAQKGQTQTKFEHNGITYERLKSKDGKLTNSVAVVENGKKYSGNVKIPETVIIKPSRFKPFSGTYEVVAIGNNAFAGCVNLTSISIPKSVLIIGDYAFAGADRLATITSYITKHIDVNIRKNVFLGIALSKKNRTLYVPAGTLAEYKASNWRSFTSNIEEMEAPAKVGDKFTYNSIAYKITSLSPRTVEVTEKNPKYSGSVAIPASVTHKGNSYSVTAIGEDAFYATALTSVTIPNSVTKIGRSAFVGTALTSVTIPASVTNIGDYAFCETSLSSVTIPASVTNIGVGVFSYIHTIQSINVDAKSSSFTSVDGALFNKSKTTLIQYPVNKSAKSYTIPNLVTTLEEGSFAGCKYLTSVTIPASVTKIEGETFFESSIATITSYITTNIDKVLNGGVFDGSDSNRTLYVPVGTLAAYKASDWTDFTSNIKEMGAKVGDTFVYNNIAYRILTSNTVIVSYLDKDNGIPVIIPETVTYKGNSYTVTDIEVDAFYGCNNLTHISIPKTVTYIEDNSIIEVPKLSEIKVDPNNSNYCSVDGVLFDKAKTTIIVYPAAKINTSYTIPSSVKEIGYDAFMNCSFLTSLTIPVSVTDINFGFRNCLKLSEIKVDPNNSNYCSVYGVLFNKAKTSIFIYPARKTNTSYTIPNSVIRIEDHAFEGCAYLTSINIPHSVKTIVDDPFNNCSKLQTISVSTDNSSYASIDGVLFNKDKTIIRRYPMGKYGNYTIPSSVTLIGYSAFRSCHFLTSLTIPASVTEIYSQPFDFCSRLSTITSYITNNIAGVLLVGNVFDSITASNRTLYVPKGKVAEYKASGWAKYTNNIKEIVSQVGDKFVYNNIAYKITSLSPRTVEVTEKNPKYSGSVAIPASVPHNSANYSVTAIGEYAFNATTTLTSVTIPNSVTAIGEYAFSANALTSVTIPNSVTNIGDYAFNGSALTSVTIPASVTNIGDYAFAYTYTIQSISVDAKSSSFASVDGALFNKSKTTLIQYPVNKSAKSYTIPNLVTTIEGGSFAGCQHLTSVTIPASVTKIKEEAFSESTDIATITSYITTNIDKVLDSSVFDGSDPNRTLYVPVGTLAAYKASDWTDFTSNIKEMGTGVKSIRTTDGKPAISLLSNIVESGQAVALTLNLSASQLAGSRLTVVNSNGAVISTLQPSSTTVSLQSPAAKGIYLVSLQLANGEVEVAKLIVR